MIDGRRVFRAIVQTNLRAERQLEISYQCLPDISARDADSMIACRTDVDQGDQLRSYSTDGEGDRDRACWTFYQGIGA